MNKKPEVKAQGIQAILEAVKADYPTIKVVVVTTIACIVILIAPFLWVLRTFVNAETIDEKLGLSAHLTPKIMGEVVKKVDSGYSRSFILRSDDPTSDTDLLFYAEPGQVVRLVMKAEAYGPKPKIQILIDNVPWLEKEVPFQINLADISEHVRRDAEGGNIHVMKVVPRDVTSGSTTVLQCLVLVANR